MPITTIRGGQVTDGTVQRVDLDVSTVGQAVVRKLVQGSNVTLSSTGADSGTGDVTINVATGINGFISKTAAYTLTTADSNKYIICSGGSWTLTLPAPALGLTFQVRNDQGISGTTGTITLQPNGGTVDGAASISLLPQQECTLISDGTNWRTLGLKREVILGIQDITTAQATGTVLLPVGYRYFELNFENVAGSVDNQHLCAQFSLDGGTTWQTAANYWYGSVYNSSSTASGGGPAAVGLAYLGWFVGTNALFQAQVKFNPGRTGGAPSWLSDASTWTSTNGYATRSSIGGFLSGATPPVNALKYYLASGNIAQSLLTVKGAV
jgi:hypothetical protein